MSALPPIAGGHCARGNAGAKVHFPHLACMCAQSAGSMLAGRCGARIKGQPMGTNSSGHPQECPRWVQMPSSHRGRCECVRGHRFLLSVHTQRAPCAAIYTFCAVIYFPCCYIHLVSLYIARAAIYILCCYVYPMPLYMPHAACRTPHAHLSLIHI